jgi:hypothetical protein
MSAPLISPVVLYRSAPADQLNEQNDDGDHQQHMNEVAGDVEAESQKPQDQQDYENGPKHLKNLLDLNGATRPEHLASGLLPLWLWMQLSVGYDIAD